MLRSHVATLCSSLDLFFYLEIREAAQLNHFYLEPPYASKSLRTELRQP